MMPPYGSIEEYVSHCVAYGGSAEEARIRWQKYMNPHAKAKRTVKRCKKFVAALTDDYTKPTKEYGQFIHELDEREQVGLYNWLVYTLAAVKDMREMIESKK